jgi:hypothetical protein
MYSKLFLTGSSILSIIVLYYFYGNKPSKSTEHTLPCNILVKQPNNI